MDLVKERLAIIGGGISGLSSACIFQDQFDVTLYEAASRLGGHSRTIQLPSSLNDAPIDTGFIVYNERNYPHLTKFFAHYDVPTQESSMSFGVDMRSIGLSYASTSVHLPTRNWLHPKFWGMIKDILRFNRIGASFLDAPLSLTLGEFLKQQNFGKWFCDYYLRPMGAAIWSCPLKTIDAYPAATFLRFFDNHGLLTVFDQPDWRTVTGGSKNYIAKILQNLKADIRCGEKVTVVMRTKDGVKIETADGSHALYDQVIMASHADQSLSALKDASPLETDILSAFQFQPNEIVVHTDKSFMPPEKKHWASWVYLSEDNENDKEMVSLSYWMNNLQKPETNTDIFVTLNPSRAPNANLVFDRHEFAHPVFTSAAVQSQGRLDEIQGKDRIWFAGAWTRYGFHEDGILSAARIAEKMGIAPPWM